MGSICHTAAQQVMVMAVAICCHWARWRRPTPYPLTGIDSLSKCLSDLELPFLWVFKGQILPHSHFYFLVGATLAICKPADIILSYLAWGAYIRELHILLSVRMAQTASIIWIAGQLRSTAQPPNAGHFFSHNLKLNFTTQNSKYES